MGNSWGNGVCNTSKADSDAHERVHNTIEAKDGLPKPLSHLKYGYFRGHIIIYMVSLLDKSWALFTSDLIFNNIVLLRKI